jgi:uncharacterized protein YcnI
MKTTLFAAILLAATAAQAHVSLEEPTATAGAGYKAVLRVSHGCEGGSPTHTVSIKLPPGFRGAKPQPKPGWNIRIDRAPLDKPYQSHGRTVSDDVVQITWQAQSREAWLSDAFYDEFVLRGSAPETPGPAWFKVLQQCEKGQSDWSQLPDGGTSTRGLKSPAVLLDVRPAAAAGHRHQH